MKTVWVPFVFALSLALSACSEPEGGGEYADAVVEQLNSSLKRCGSRAFGHVTGEKQSGIIEIEEPWFRVYEDDTPPEGIEWTGKIYANGDTYRIYNATRQTWGFWKDDAKRGVPLHQDPESRGMRVINAQLKNGQWYFDPAVESLDEPCDELLALKE